MILPSTLSNEERNAKIAFGLAIKCRPGTSLKWPLETKGFLSLVASWLRSPGRVKPSSILRQVSLVWASAVSGVVPLAIWAIPWLQTVCKLRGAVEQAEERMQAQLSGPFYSLQLKRVPFLKLPHIEVVRPPHSWGIVFRDRPHVESQGQILSPR